MGRARGGLLGRGDGGAGPAGQRVPQPGQRRDDRPASAAVQELEGGLDLGPHGAGGELAGRQVGAGLGRPQVVESSLTGRTEPDVDLVHPRDQHEGVHAGDRGQQGGGAVLVDHRVHAVPAAVLSQDGNPAAARGDHDGAGVEQDPDLVGLHDPPGSWARDDAVEHSGRGLRDCPAARRSDLGRRSRQLRPDRLGRGREGRVVAGHLGVGEDGDRPRGHPAAEEGAVDRHREEVPDPALRVRDGEPQGELRQALDLGLGGNQFAPAQDEAHLRPVAVGDQHPPAVDDEIGHLLGEGGGALLLAGDGTRLAVEDQGVAADRDQRGAVHRMFRTAAMDGMGAEVPAARRRGHPRPEGQGTTLLGTDEG